MINTDAVSQYGVVYYKNDKKRVNISRLITHSTKKKKKIKNHFIHPNIHHFTTKPNHHKNISLEIQLIVNNS